MIFFYPSLALILVRNIALVPLYFRYIGQTEFDAWLVTGAVLMQLTNVDLGLMGVLSQQVAAAYGSRNRIQLQQLIGTGLILAAAIALLMGCVTAAISPLIPLFFDVPPEVGHRVSLCFLIVAVANAIQLFGFSTGGLLRSLQRAFLYGFFVLVSEIISLISTIYLLRSGWGLYSIGIGLVIRAGVEVLGTGLTFLWISMVRLKLRYEWNWPQVRRLWGFSIYQFLTQVTGRIKVTMDGLLIGLFIGTKPGGDYTLTVRAHDTVRMFSGGFTGSLSQPLAHLHGEGDVPRYKQVISDLFRVTLFTGAIGYGGAIAFNHAFMLLWVGPTIYSGNAVNVMIAMAGISYALLVVPYEALYTRAGFSAITRVSWSELIVRIVVMIALLKMIGVLGTPLAAFLCQTFGLFLPLAWINIRSLRFTAAEIGSLIVSMVKLLAGPLILAGMFFSILHNRPLTCTFTVSRGHVDQVVQQLTNQFPPASGVSISHQADSARFHVTAIPKLQEQVGGLLMAMDVVFREIDSPVLVDGLTSHVEVVHSIPAPPHEWLVLARHAGFYVILSLVYTWFADRRLIMFMLRGGRAARVPDR